MSGIQALHAITDFGPLTLHHNVIGEVLFCREHRKSLANVGIQNSGIREIAPCEILDENKTAMESDLNASGGRIIFVIKPLLNATDGPSVRANGQFCRISFLFTVPELLSFAVFLLRICRDRK